MKNGGAKTNKVFVDDEIDFELKNKSQKNDPNLIFIEDGFFVFRI